MEEIKAGQAGWLPKGTPIITGKLSRIDKNDWNSPLIVEGKIKSLKEKMLVVAHRDSHDKKCVFRPGEADEGEVIKENWIQAPAEKFVLHKDKSPKLKSKCKYCGKIYHYYITLGDLNHGACNNARCILASMRETM